MAGGADACLTPSMSDDPNELRPTPSPADQLRAEPPKDAASLVALRAIVGLLAYLVSWVLPLLGPLLLLIYAVFLARARKYPGFPLGVFIGVGLSLLLAGACFVAISNAHF